MNETVGGKTGDGPHRIAPVDGRSGPCLVNTAVVGSVEERPETDTHAVGAEVAVRLTIRVRRVAIKVGASDVLLPVALGE